jgi:hypothetical protein
LETARKRIIYFIENQRIKPSEFLKKTELKKGFIDKSHQDSGASDITLAKILECYPNLSANWLLTGKGEMLLENANESLIVEKTVFKENLNSKEFKLLKKDLETLKADLQKMNEEIGQIKQSKG